MVKCYIAFETENDNSGVRKHDISEKIEFISNVSPPSRLVPVLLIVMLLKIILLF